MDNDVVFGGLGGELLQVFLGGSLLHFPVEVELASVCAACVSLSSGGKLCVGMGAPEQDRREGIVLMFAQGKIVHERSYSYDEQLASAKGAKRNANLFLSDVRLKRW
jgi:hypothetical protein